MDVVGDFPISVNVGIHVFNLLESVVIAMRL